MRAGATVLVLLTGWLIVACSSKKPAPLSLDNPPNEPRVFEPGLISTDEFHESLNALSPDQQTLYFTRADAGFSSSTLLKSERGADGWDKPEVLPFSGKEYDAGLTFSPQGDLAFFTSKRAVALPGISTEWNIWKVSHEDGQWGSPEVLGTPINSDSLECCLTMNLAGQTYFSSTRDGSWDIYEARFDGEGFYGVRRMGAALNTEAGEWPGYVNPSGTQVYFSSIRKTGPGGDDLYRVTKTEEGWGEASLLPAYLNTTAFDDSPIFSPDGRIFFYSCWEDTDFSKGKSNVYWVDATVLKDIPSLF